MDIKYRHIQKQWSIFSIKLIGKLPQTLKSRKIIEKWEVPPNFHQEDLFKQLLHFKNSILLYI